MAPVREKEPKPQNDKHKHPNETNLTRRHHFCDERQRHQNRYRGYAHWVPERPFYSRATDNQPDKSDIYSRIAYYKNPFWHHPAEKLHESVGHGTAIDIHPVVALRAEQVGERFDVARTRPYRFGNKEAIVNIIPEPLHGRAHDCNHNSTRQQNHDGCYRTFSIGI